ncbi:hypothetical protein B0H12DRAFT_1069830 [Mycena haematopus]|nr:hypothetical protein B0H12DRAFT_1069830 [Mycena haematopus]
MSSTNPILGSSRSTILHPLGHILMHMQMISLPPPLTPSPLSPLRSRPNLLQEPDVVVHLLAHLSVVDPEELGFFGGAQTERGDEVHDPEDDVCVVYESGQVGVREKSESQERRRPKSDSPEAGARSDSTATDPKKEKHGGAKEEKRKGEGASAFPSEASHHHSVIGS